MKINDKEKSKVLHLYLVEVKVILKSVVPTLFYRKMYLRFQVRAFILYQFFQELIPKMLNRIRYLPKKKKIEICH